MTALEGLEGEPGTPLEGSAQAGVAGRYSVTSPAPPHVWRDLVAVNPDALITQTPEWMASIVSVGRWRDQSRLYELASGRQLLVPLVGLGRGPAMILKSLPAGSGYGGALASDGTLTPSDVTLVSADLSRTKALSASLVPTPYDTVWNAAAATATGRVGYLTHILDLARGRERVWKAYSSNVRRSVRRAERSGVEIRRDVAGALLPVFTELHRKSMDRWASRAGRPVRVARLHQRFLEFTDRLPSISRQLPERLAVWAAFVGGEPAAAIVVLRGERQALYWRGAMDRELAAPTHANALLHHLAIEEAINDGAGSYCFGESDLGSDLAVYKAKFGAEPVSWFSYQWERLPLTAAAASLRAGYGRVAPRVVGVVAGSTR
jgi:hypothetical protein